METSLEEYLQENPDGFRVSSGIIRSPGKYEGEPLYVPYFDAEVAEDFGENYRVFYLTEKEKEIINTLDDVLILHYTESGFVESETCSKPELEIIR